MDYIVAGARFTDEDKKGEGHVFSTATPALEKAIEMEAEGYTVSIQTPGHGKLSIAELQSRIESGEVS